MKIDRSRISGVLALGAIVLFSTGLPAGATAAETTEPRLRDAIERALADNPDIEEMEHRIHVARFRVPQARALPEPMLTIGAVNVPVAGFSFRQDDMTMKMVTLEQEIPAPGKRAAAARVAEAELQMVRTMHMDHVNRLAAEVADGYFDLASLDARIAIQRRSIGRLEGVSESVRSRYRVGHGALPDALLAGVEETKARDRLRSLQAERAAAAARFNTLQNLPPGQTVEPVPLPAPDRAIPDAATLSEALASSPAIRQAQADVGRAEEELRLARLQRRPDFTLMSSYGQRDRRDDMVGATVGFSLPFVARRRIEARIAEKEAELSATKSRLAVVRLDLSRQVEEALIALASEDDRSTLYRDTILTQIETAARAAQEAYAVGKIDFQTYVQAALALDEGESETIERETAIPRARARLQAATGIGFYPPRAVEESSHDQ
jgi:cobalt-zinc-cadmium efflux system outer membrane protein